MNVLLVVLEGGRADYMSCYGAEAETTPFVDQLARQGVRFAHAYTTATSPLPAIASLLTGLFPCAHGATEESPQLPPGVPLLPEVLRGAGYRTAAFSPSPAITPATGFGRGFDRFSTGSRGPRLAGRAADYARRASDRVLGRSDGGARRSSDALIEWVRGGTEPFCALVHFTETAGARPPAPYDRTFAAPGRDEQVACHEGALRYLDLRLQEIAAELDRLGCWEQTLVLVTATHGVCLQASESDAGAELSVASLPIPLVLRAPGCVPRGFVVADIAQPSDVFPTVAALAGVAMPDVRVQGRVLLRDGGATPGPRWAFAESYRGDVNGPRCKALRGPREHFVWRSDEANTFFDLGEGVGRDVNRFASQSARADSLRRELFDWLSACERWTHERGLSMAPTGIVPARQDVAAE